MRKLLDHFKKMQGLTADYISPGPYTSLNGDTHTEDCAAEAWQNDIIKLLDGAEQREAQREAESADEQVADLLDSNQELRDKVAVAQSDLGRATKKLDVVKDERNGLRRQLQQRDLDYAKLRGYLDRMIDEQPPRTVVERRVPAHAGYPDGTKMSEDDGQWYQVAGRFPRRQP